MKDQDLLRETTVEALQDDEWKLFVPQGTLDEIELTYGSNPKFTTQVGYETKLKQEVKVINSKRQ